MKHLLTDINFLKILFSIGNISGIFPRSFENKVFNYCCRLIYFLVTSVCMICNTLFLYNQWILLYGDTTFRFLCFNSYLFNQAYSITVLHGLVKDERYYNCLLENIESIDSFFGKHLTFKIDRIRLFVTVSVQILYFYRVITKMSIAGFLLTFNQIYFLICFYQVMVIVIIYEQLMYCLRKRYEFLETILISVGDSHGNRKLNKINLLKNVYNQLNKTTETVNLMFGKYLFFTFLMAFYTVLAKFTFLMYYVKDFTENIEEFFDTIMWMVSIF